MRSFKSNENYVRQYLPSFQCVLVVLLVDKSTGSQQHGPPGYVFLPSCFSSPRRVAFNKIVAVSIRFDFTFGDKKKRKLSSHSKAEQRLAVMLTSLGKIVYEC